MQSNFITHGNYQIRMEIWIWRWKISSLLRQMLQTCSKIYYILEEINTKISSAAWEERQKLSYLKAKTNRESNKDLISRFSPPWFSRYRQYFWAFLTTCNEIFTMSSCINSGRTLWHRTLIYDVSLHVEVLLTSFHLTVNT